VPAWIEVFMQIDTIQNVGDEFLQEQARRHADLAAQAARHGAGECVEVAVVHDTAQPRLVGLTFDVDVANTPSYGQQGGMVERGQADLNRTGVVEATVGGGVVKATVNGEGALLSISIDRSVVDPDDVETLEDLVVAAVHEATRQAKVLQQEKLGAVTPDLGSLDLGALGLGDLGGMLG
jgi:DNA-binding YbaB/EbfC family protein